MSAGRDAVASRRGQNGVRRTFPGGRGLRPGLVGARLGRGPVQPVRPPRAGCRSKGRPKREQSVGACTEAGALQGSWLQSFGERRRGYQGRALSPGQQTAGRNVDHVVRATTSARSVVEDCVPGQTLSPGPCGPRGNAHLPGQNQVAPRSRAPPSTGVLSRRPPRAVVGRLVLTGGRGDHVAAHVWPVTVIAPPAVGDGVLESTGVVAEDSPVAETIGLGQGPVAASTAILRTAYRVT